MKSSLKSFAYFGGGCFWCTESIFQRLKGVLKVTSGYAGGDSPNPSYNTVSSGRTGHAEIIRIEFNPHIISYKQLLTVFFTTHDPTTPNQQGHDSGSQYRSIILTNSLEQKNETSEKIKEINKQHIFNGPIVTEVEPLKNFYEAESYHQDYFTNHQTESYCQIVIFPKITLLKQEFSHLLK